MAVLSQNKKCTMYSTCLAVELFEEIDIDQKCFMNPKAVSFLLPPAIMNVNRKKKMRLGCLIASPPKVSENETQVKSI